MATRKSNKEVATKSDQMPEFLKNKMNDDRGSEDVGADDITIPRVEVVQALSKCRKKSDPSYINGIEEGQLYNNITREVYGESITVIPVKYRKEYLLWRDQDLGGGFAGSYPTHEEAEKVRAQQEAPDEWESVDTGVHFVIVVKEDGTLEEAVISMAKSKAKVSRDWNTLVRMNGGPRFSRQYTITGVPAQNAKSQDYYNLSVKSKGFVTEEQFEKAEIVYELVQAGAAKVDESGYEEGETYDAEM